MSDVASKDENNVSSLLGVSSADGTSPIKVYASPTSHRLLVDGVGVTGPTDECCFDFWSFSHGFYYLFVANIWINNLPPQILWGI